jgi:hypothetical protein
VSEGFPNVLQLDLVIARSGLGVESVDELADNVVLANVLFGGEHYAFRNREVESVLMEALDNDPRKQAPYALSLSFPGREVSISLSIVLGAGELWNFMRY